MEDNTSEEDDLYAEVGSFYFNTDSLHDVQFVVGEQQEIIKAVRLPLINQSRVLWNMLCQDSPLAEKGDIYIPDIEPNIFNLLLRHSYGGLDSLDELSEDDIMKLCYCANKYMMKSLMKKIAAHIEPRDVESLFVALHCLVYFNLKDVEDAVKKIVQTRTLETFKHTKFMDCDVDSVTYICKQEPLSCDEITVWNYVVQWAKAKAKCEEGLELREWLGAPLKHVRLRTLSVTDLHKHVFSLSILSSREIGDICKDESVCPSVCSCKVTRYCAVEKTHNTMSVSVEISHKPISSMHYLEIDKSTSYLIVNSKSIKLQSFVLRGFCPYSSYENCNDYRLVQKYNTSIKVSITKITDSFTKTSSKKPVIIQLKNFSYHSFDRFTVPTLIDNKGIPLESNNKYKIELTIGENFPSWAKADCVDGHTFDHGKFYCSEAYVNGKGVTSCHIFEFTYEVADD